jgi:PadR family transcriptional regulator PadR
MNANGRAMLAEQRTNWTHFADTLTQLLEKPQPTVHLHTIGDNS